MGRTVVSAHRNGSNRTGAPPLAGWLLQTRTNGTDGLDGALVGQGWERRTLAGAGTGAPTLALEGQRAMRSGSCNQYYRRGVFVSDK